MEETRLKRAVAGLLKAIEETGEKEDEPKEVPEETTEETQSNYWVSDDKKTAQVFDNIDWDDYNGDWIRTHRKNNDKSSPSR